MELLGQRIWINFASILSANLASENWYLLIFFQIANEMEIMLIVSFSLKCLPMSLYLLSVGA